MKLAARLSYHALTLILFTGNDFKTTIFPMGAFAIGAAPLDSERKISNILQVIFWSWLHLLQFNLANQTRDLEEDKLNKPWRPLPAGRITLQNAIYLRWLSIVASLLLSSWYSGYVLATSITYTIAVTLYHELNGHGHWLMKSFMNATGLTTIALASTLIAGRDRSVLDHTAKLALGLLFVILATTTHTQDFPDVEGDRLVGRKTIPIVLPDISRYTPFAIMVPWSFCLSSVWKADPLVQMVLVTLAVVTGYRYFRLRKTEDDRLSFLLYNIWLSIALTLPGYYRLFKETSGPSIYLAAGSTPAFNAFARNITL